MPKPSEILKKLDPSVTPYEWAVATAKILNELHEENRNLKRAVGILVEYAQARPHRGGDLAEDIENAKQFRKDSEWLSQFLTQDNE